MIIEGYASVFNVEDSTGDVVLPGAFSGYSKSMMRYRHMPIDLGLWDYIVEDEYGLWVSGSTNDTLITKSIIDRTSLGLSIGFSPVRWDYASRGQRVIHSVHLVEISVVSNPMQPKATIFRYKGKDDDHWNVLQDPKEEVEPHLRVGTHVGTQSAHRDKPRRRIHPRIVS